MCHFQSLNRKTERVIPNWKKSTFQHFIEMLKSTNQSFELTRQAFQEIFLLSMRWRAETMFAKVWAKNTHSAKSYSKVKRNSKVPYEGLRTFEIETARSGENYLSTDSNALEGRDTACKSLSKKHSLSKKLFNMKKNSKVLIERFCKSIFLLLFWLFFIAVFAGSSACMFRRLCQKLATQNSISHSKSQTLANPSRNLDWTFKSVVWGCLLCALHSENMKRCANQRWTVYHSLVWLRQVWNEKNANPCATLTLTLAQLGFEFRSPKCQSNCVLSLVSVESAHGLLRTLLGSIRTQELSSNTWVTNWVEMTENLGWACGLDFGVMYPPFCTRPMLT